MSTRYPMMARMPTIPKFKSLVIVALASMCVPAGWCFGADKTSAKCHVPELFGQKDYDDLVCAGIAKGEQRDYRGAIALFEKAMDIPLFEFPNFELFSRLALAYDAAGDKKKANETLSKAELALKVFTRIFKCKEVRDNYVLVREVWGKAHAVKSPYLDEIASRMCGEMYESLYSPERLDPLMHESSLVKGFLDAKKKIGG